VDGCIDLLASVPGNRPVAFRMPCCDSLNTNSPRFYAEIFNKTTPKGNFLTLDSSVFQLFTPDDPELPRELVLDPDGRERFRKYIIPDFGTGDRPAERSNRRAGSEARGWTSGEVNEGVPCSQSVTTILISTQPLGPSDKGNGGTARARSSWMSLRK